MRHAPLSFSLAALAAAAIAGCATTTPVAEQSLQNAHAAYQAAQNDPKVRQYAPGELAQASGALTRADQMQKEGRGDDLISHQSYLATQAANTAREIGLARANQAELANADAQRNKILLEARTREAEKARHEAELARAQADSVRASQAQAAQAAQNRDADIARLQAELESVKAQRTSRGWVVTLPSNVLFDTADATLKPGAQQSLNEIARVMREHPEATVTVEGYTDNQGSFAYNRMLSDQRAQAVKQALMQSGVDASRITARGYGQGYPIASNDNPEGRQLNRRVQIVVAPGSERSSATGGTAAPGR
jgi:outer membrane protein OmpA-like peptidoglycan-associated protein